MSQKKTIGIIGGMGPMATYDLGQKIVANTKAEKDQDHLHVLIDCNTAIPDRTAAILGQGEDPLPEMVGSARRLEQGGADFLVMPCNTAHHFYDKVSSSVNIPVLHMPRETAALLREMGIRKAGILATDGTCRAGVYEEALKEEGLESVYPGEAHQKMIMSMIYDHVKAGDMDFSSLDVDGLLRSMEEAGAEILILGCTELPLAFESLGITEGTVDPTVVLARAAVREAGGELK